MDRVMLAEALNLIEAWNAELAAGSKPQFSPTIGCALNAGMPWQRLHCPGCRRVYEIDVRQDCQASRLSDHGTITHLRVWLTNKRPNLNCLDCLRRSKAALERPALAISNSLTDAAQPNNACA